MRELIRSSRHAAEGQIIVIAALAMIVVVGMVALVLESGNAYAQQRHAQNGADASANAGAAVLALHFGDASITDATVNQAVQDSAVANEMTSAVAYYTDVTGQYMDAAGSAPVAKGSAAVVGTAAIPSRAQGVAVDGTREFEAFIARAIGFTRFTAGVNATAIAGRLTGGAFLPVVFPISITDCEGNGSVGAQEIEGDWRLSQPPATPGGRPVGQEYIVPLCKTGSGSFQILDFDPSLKCDEEIAQGITVTLTLPTDVDSDNGNDCASKIVDEVNALRGKVVFVPICDNATGGTATGQCQTKGGSKATYHIVKVAAFWLDYMADSNNANKPDAKCQSLADGSIVTLPGTDINGNGSSSCIAGYFVRYISAGTVDTGANSLPDGDNDAIGIQLIK